MKTIRTGTKRSKFTEHAIYENGYYYFPKTLRRDKKTSFISACYFDRYRGKWEEDTFRLTEELTTRITDHAKKNGLLRTYNVQSNVGKARHVVNFHDGQKTHPDGSPFYDVRTFNNKDTLATFIKALEEQDYTEEK